MAARTLQAFERRVGLFVTLVIAFVLTIGGLAVVRQYQAHQSLERQVRERTYATTALVLAQLGPEQLREGFSGYQRRGTVPQVPRELANRMRERGVAGIRLLNAEGWALGSRSGATAAGASGQLDERLLGKLGTGAIQVDLEAALSARPEYAFAVGRAPVLDRSSQLAGVVEVSLGASALASSKRQLTWGLALQGAALLAFALLLGSFMRWTLRPLRLLEAATSAQDEQATDEYEKQDDTGFVVETYRRAIDELREKEQELRRLRELERHRANELQDLNASIIDSMVSGVLVLDLSGRVRSLNDPGREVLGVGDEPATGRPFQKVLGQVPELHPRLQACLDEGEVIRRDDIRLNLPGVGRRDVGLTVSPLVDREGARTGALCLAVDLTEVKRLQEQVRQQESLAELGELSGGVAHEFRNSLAAMLGYAKLVERQAEGEVVEHAREIIDEVGTLRRVVDDFLRFANPTRLVLEPIALDELFEELRDDVKQRAGAKEVTLEIAGELPAITGDETLLRRAFTNLLRNAADAVGDGGHIRVTGESREGELRLLVEDDGPGIPEDDRERIFIPFVSRKDQGTGLGLALTRKVIVHHGGRISAAGSELGGASFRVVLPLRGERSANGAPGSPRTAPGHEK